MRHFAIILTIIFSLAVNTVQAQYASVNVDYKTMEAMSEAFTTEAAMEALHNENLQKIYDSYKAAEIASAGIFSSKYLDRKALTNLNLWDDKKENYYYSKQENYSKDHHLRTADGRGSFYGNLLGQLSFENHRRRKVPLPTI